MVFIVSPFAKNFHHSCHNDLNLYIITFVDGFGLVFKRGKEIMLRHSNNEEEYVKLLAIFLYSFKIP